MIKAYLIIVSTAGFAVRYCQIGKKLWLKNLFKNLYGACNGSGVNSIDPERVLGF